ncbi:succinate--CoA ligase subunit alpha [Alloscardovia criceti]|uniref:succinate--CoA ligase subunit alpha n=1 Tax=Alloscardovia criceti TaxID=356828 RepID=UPI00038166FB|nr:succinate--CoA ligase subunit alpha [Alloscardovia criceti]
MSFIRPNAPVIVQGMTGHQGMTHTARMLKAGTNIVAGVNPRKGGQSLHFEDLNGARDVSIYATCREARENTGAEASVIFVPPRFAKAAMVEAIEAEIPLIVVITEGIPVADTAYCVALARKKGVRIVGPNCPGLATYTTPDKMSTGTYGVNLGIIPDGIVHNGPLGLVSKSGTLTYQMMSELSDYGFGAAIGVGGDPIVGTTQQEALEILNEDPRIKACVLIGEIGGSAEQELALWAQDHMNKPVVAYIAGYSAPEGKQMGHAGAIVSGGSGTAQGKKEALEACGIKVGKNPTETAQFMREILEQL